MTNSSADVGVLGSGCVPDDPPRRDFGSAGQGLDFGSDQVSCTSNYRSTPQQTASFRNAVPHERRTEIILVAAALLALTAGSLGWLA